MSCGAVSGSLGRKLGLGAGVASTLVFLRAGGGHVGDEKIDEPVVVHVAEIGALE